MSSDSRQQVWDVFAKAMETFDKKNADYGDAWKTNGWRGNLSRIFEKVQRVRNLAWRPDPRVPAVGDEQVLETLQDLLNTTAFAIINMIEEREYGHEVPRSERINELANRYEPGAATAFFDQVASELPHEPKPLTSLPDEEISREPLHHTEVQVVAHGHDEVVRTEFIPADAVRAATAQPHGPDEMRPAEASHGTRVARKNGGGRNRPVVDNPQA
jgi:hypothetical protein